eukprot:CAMPEP_0172502556 /NCGR_PEP_ID=MMETSP1066-20121228/160983_1 /TAXON_ID=671091 /ORGANISM="Coscinodiscus wailesii, Strain CCMP2513" /LENGTH=370 /DNA_ID=CAMNT_0013277855 /DNA_START=147 /DNA_END=1259 /DNA_ORIENTATION=-
MTDIEDHPQFSVGTLVDVEPRTWSGICKWGGAGKVTKIYRDEDGTERVNVKYLVGGGTEKNIELIWVKPQLFEERSSRSRRIDVKYEPPTGSNSRTKNDGATKGKRQRRNRTSLKSQSTATKENSKSNRSRGVRRGKVEIYVDSLSIKSNPTIDEQPVNSTKKEKDMKTNEKPRQLQNTESLFDPPPLIGPTAIPTTIVITQPNEIQSSKPKQNDNVTNKLKPSTVKKNPGNRNKRTRKRNLEPNPANDNCIEMTGESPTKKKKPLSTIHVENMTNGCSTEPNDFVKPKEQEPIMRISDERMSMFTSLLRDVMRHQEVSDCIKLDDLLVEVNKRIVKETKFTEVEVRSCIKTLEDENRIYLADSGIVYSI